MTLLAEINLGSALPWGDDTSHVWGNTDDHTWFDGAGYALCSMEGFAGDRYWDAYIVDFTPPRYQAATEHGGYCAMTFGGITFSLDLFAGTGRWPPPPSFQLKIWYTEIEEALKYELFTGSAHLERLNIEVVEYSLYGTEYDQELLTEQHQYNEVAEDTGYTDDHLAPVPRAFGEVLHVAPMRAPDDGSTRPTYYMSGITGTLAKVVSDAADNGSGKVRFTTSAAHGFTNGDTVTVEVDDFSSTYNTTQIATVIDGTHFDFTSIAYVDDQAGHAFKSGYWRAYDDGVPISGNVIKNGQDPVTLEYTFSLSVSLVGSLTISGTGEDSTVDEIFSWACQVTRLNLTYEDSYKRDPSPTVNFWATSQTVLLDFLSDLSAFFTHLFYIAKDTLFIVDLKADHGDRTLEDGDFFPSDYAQGDPVSMYKCTGTVAERKEDRTGKRIENTETEVTLVGAYPYGSEMSITPYSTSNTVIATALLDIKAKMESATTALRLPLLGNLKTVWWGNTPDHTWGDDGHTWLNIQEHYPPPLPGERLWILDTGLKQNLHVGMICMGIQYDFKQGIVSIDGRGSIAVTRDELT